MPRIWPTWVAQADTTAWVTASTTAGAWPTWCANHPPVTGGQAYALTATVWQSWNTATTTASIIDPWPLWTTTGNTNGLWQAEVRSVSPRIDTPRDALVRANRSRAAALRARIAQRRAEALLLAHLSEEQRREWEEGEAFHVETAGGRRRYRITRGLAGNVVLVRDGDRVASPGVARGLARYCCHVYHPDGRIPDEDNVLAQKLMLETDEEEFLRLANVS